MCQPLVIVYAQTLPGIEELLTLNLVDQLA